MSLVDSLIRRLPYTEADIRRHYQELLNDLQGSKSRLRIWGRMDEETRERVVEGRIEYARLERELYSGTKDMILDNGQTVKGKVYRAVRTGDYLTPDGGTYRVTSGARRRAYPDGEPIHIPSIKEEW